MTTSRVGEFVRNFAQNGMKLLLENGENVHDLLALGRAKVLNLIDFGTVTPAGTSYVARDYRHVEADLVLTAELLWPGGPPEQQLVLYILIEHQSEPDEFMGFRVLEYVVQIYRAQIREQSQGRTSLRGIRLQPVLPVVLYTGSRSWKKLPTLKDLIHLAKNFAPWLPGLKPVFVSVKTLAPAWLEGQGGFFGQVLRLVRKRQARPAEFQALLGEVIHRLEGMPEAQRFRRLDFLSYIDALLYHERDPSEHPRLYQAVETAVQSDRLKQEVIDVRKTMADVLKEEGALQTLREMLLRLLRKRFREVPEGVTAAVETNTDLDCLKTWIENVTTAKKLKDVGIPTAP
jgi:hypothetical protein